MLAIKPKSKSRPRATRLTNRRWTFDELAAEVPESNQPMELWDGEPIMSPSPSFFHQQIAFQFQKRLDAWVTEHRLGTTVGAPIDMVLAPHRTTQPDVLFISNERLRIIEDRVRGAADLVAEVISPESRRRDRIEKRDLYEQHGVREYWIIDPEAETIEALFLDRDEFRLIGRWRLGEQARSQLLKGFTVAVAELFAKRR
ncbi:MAG: restriction endonuclease [Verrucomicrobia bacterium]|nr:MAG: restriction endonuclease [Verrucomicrobiota bacterium]